MYLMPFLNENSLKSLNLVTKPPNSKESRGGRIPDNANKNRFPDKVPGKCSLTSFIMGTTTMHYVL